MMLMELQAFSIPTVDNPETRAEPRLFSVATDKRSARAI